MFTSAPNFIDFNITNACNMNCRHCYLGQGNDEYIALKDAKKILDDIAEMGVFMVALTGGEPFLHPEWQEIFGYIVELGIQPMFNTNGTTLTGDTVDFLYNIYGNKIKFAISVDGSDPESYAILRKWKNGQGANKGFDHVISVIDRLIKYGFSITLNYTFTGKNYQYITEFYNFVEKRYKDHKNYTINIIKFGQSGNGAVFSDELEVSYDLWKDFLVQTTKLKKQGLFKRLMVEPTCPWEVYLPLKEFSFEEIEKLWYYKSPLRNPIYAENRSIGCHGAISNVVINWDGRVYPCGLYPNNETAYLGNALEQSLSDIWNHSAMIDELRKIELKDIGEPCISCYYADICGGGCRGAAAAFTGSNLGLDLRCPNVQNFIKKKKIREEDESC